MKAEEIRGLSDSQLQEKMVELSKEQMNLRFQKATGTMENPNRWREVRKDRARMKTEATARAAAAAK